MNIRQIPESRQDQTSEEAWVPLKEGVESVWDTMEAAVPEAAAKFKDWMTGQRPRPMPGQGARPQITREKESFGAGALMI